MFDQTPEEGRPGRAPSINVLGGALQPCSHQPPTGFYRDGCCNTGREDVGLHTVCVVMTASSSPSPRRRATTSARRCRNTASPA